MPPQESDSPNPQYDFIMKDQQKTSGQKKSIIPKGNLPKILLLVGGGLFVVALIIVVVSAISNKGGGSWQVYINQTGRAGEIVRVSTLVSQKTKDGDTLNLAATVIATLTSQQNELNAYLKHNKVKVDPKSLVLFTNKTTDNSLAAAQQNNSLEGTYDNYLKTQLTDYETHIKTAAATAGTKGLELLKGEQAGVQTILASPQLAKS